MDWDLANSVAIRFFQRNQGISSWSSLGQELLCEQVHHLAERWSCPTGDACSLWLDLAAAWWHSRPLTGVHFGLFVHKGKLCIRLKNQRGYFLCQNRSLITCSLWKMHIYVQVVIIFECNEILQRNLQDMWPESSSVNAVNLAKNYYNSRDIKFFLGDYFFGAPCKCSVLLQSDRWHSLAHFSNSSCRCHTGISAWLPGSRLSIRLWHYSLHNAWRWTNDVEK